MLGDPVERFEREFAAFVGLPHVVGTATGPTRSPGVQRPRPAGGSPVLVAANEGGYAATAARQAGLVPRVMDVDPTMGPVVAEAEAAWLPGVSSPGRHPPARRRSPADRARRVAPEPRDRTGRGLRAGPRPRRRRRPRRHARRRRHVQLLPDQEPRCRGGRRRCLLPARGTAARARALGQYGWGERFRVELPVAATSRLDTLQAAVLSARLPHLARRNARRRAIADRYRIAVKGSGPPPRRAATSVAHHAVVARHDRDGLRAHLEGRGVTAASTTPTCSSEMPGLRARAAVAPRSRPGCATGSEPAVLPGDDRPGGRRVCTRWTSGWSPMAEPREADVPAPTSTSAAR